MNTNYSNRRISHNQARTWMEQYPEAIILDVRSNVEYSNGHIRNALLLPVDILEDKAEQMMPDKNALILVYCRSGIRSCTAVQQLYAMGYKEVYDFGGILSWPYGITLR